MAPNGAPSVKGWGRAVDERRLFISILTLAEYDKGIANLAGDDPNVQRYIATRDALEARFTARILSLSDPIVRRWGAISGHMKRETGHPPPVIDTLLAATAIEAWDERRATPEGRDDWPVPHPAVAADGRPSVRAAHSGAA